MLELNNIVKVYPAGGSEVRALKGVSLTFRENEFVSILGPSGCGKTTLLNIIGGLDHYTEGDLVINGRSTKEYKDRDWDSYRNHSIGFVFQSYNLIPHQTVLQNVELALTLSGVSKKERRERARKALEQVGLGDQLKKRPSEMSGGQMQRVAIARAIVNNPDIILADEPTGALDTETSLQVMDILKEIAKDRLVIMVTHNPDLARDYSTRIIRMLDGRLLDDSHPLSDAEIRSLSAVDRSAGKTRKPAMSLWTSFGLSLRNLFTKKGRTTLTSFAGSIGIIGIALIYAVSQGTTNYIDRVQEDTLSSYPLSIQEQTVDISSLITTFMGKSESTSEHEKDAVYQKAMLYELLNAVNSLETQHNDLTAFMEYIEEQRKNPESALAKSLSAVQYSYNLNPLIYTLSVDGDVIRSDSSSLMLELIGRHMGANASGNLSGSGGTNSSMMSMMRSGGGRGLWQELMPGSNGEAVNPLLKKQYDLVYGAWPEKYDEIVLFVDEKNELDDMTLYAMGLKTREEIDQLANAAVKHEVVEYETHKWSFEEICRQEFHTVLNSSCYVPGENGTYTDLRETSAGIRYLYDNGLILKVVGIVRPSEASLSASGQGSIGYTAGLVEYMIKEAEKSEAVAAQKASPDRDIFNGMLFKKQDELNNAQKTEVFKEYVEGLTPEKKAALYVDIMSIPEDSMVELYLDEMLKGVTREQLTETLMGAMAGQLTLDASTLQQYINSMTDEDLFRVFREMAGEQYRQKYAEQVALNMAMMSVEQLNAALAMAMQNYSEEQCAAFYDSVVVFSAASYSYNLRKLGCLELDKPSAIELYAASFEDKDTIEAEIAAYNRTVEDVKAIEYTDYVGIMMSSVTTIINAITYVLIAFVAVSLIVSSIMIGVITLISVQERTKEIGILRAIGASKKNVSSMFNAETVIIGFTSGALGVIVTYLLCIPINIVLHKVTKISNLSAVLPLPVAATLILISMFLTLIAGIIPSRSAAKKDPVVALRTE